MSLTQGGNNYEEKQKSNDTIQQSEEQELRNETNRQSKK